jgi:CHAD domain-containing protein
MNKKSFKYLVLPDFSFQDFLNQLSESYTFRLNPGQKSLLIFYDTFDWRLYSTRQILYSVGNTVFLRKLFMAEFLDSDRFRKPFSTLSHFPSGKIKNIILKIIQARALYPIGQTYEKITTIEILNTDQKVIAKVYYYEYRNQPDSTCHYSFLLLEPVKDYNNSFYELEYWFGLKAFEKDKKSDVLFHLSTNTTKTPGDYSSKLDVKVKPNSNAGQALINVLNYLLTIIKANKDYLFTENDPEFLHDFRVACRRIKSLLGSQNVLDPIITKEFKKDITDLLKTTNELRDLDVYLLNTEYYKSLLPKDFSKKINFLFTYLKRRKHNLNKNLDKEAFNKSIDILLSKWDSALNQEPEKIVNSKESAFEIKELASKEIYKNYNQILRTGKLIVKTKNKKKMHELRIQCKKLRYLMDIYKSLFPANKIDILIKQLKALQNNLGDYNDLFVQHKYLISISNRFSSKNKNLHDSLMAIGILIGLLHQKKVETANEFYSIFKDFAKPGNKELFKELFS